MDSDTLKILKVMLKLDGVTIDGCHMGDEEEDPCGLPSGRIFKDSIPLDFRPNYHFEPCTKHVHLYSGNLNRTIEIKGEDDR